LFSIFNAALYRLLLELIRVHCSIEPTLFVLEATVCQATAASLLSHFCGHRNIQHNDIQPKGILRPLA
jgi:hypothetical protein